MLEYDRRGVESWGEIDEIDEIDDWDVTVPPVAPATGS